MIVEIKGVQFSNKGAELMLHAILQELNKITPAPEIVLAPNPNSPYSERVKLNALQKLSLKKNWLDLNRLAYLIPRKLRNRLKESYGLVTEADIDVVLDASGFSYGDQWPDIYAQVTGRQICRMARYNKKFIFLPQAFGPFAGKAQREVVRHKFGKSTLIFARDTTSYQYLDELIENKSSLRMAPDFTSLISGGYAEPGCANAVLIIPNQKMESSKNADHKWARAYPLFLADAVASINELNLEPVLLNHGGKEDSDICERVHNLSMVKPKIVTESDPLKIKAMIGSSRGVICSRFHGCVSALVQGVPCIGTGWSHKYTSLFAQYERKQYLLTEVADKTELKKLLKDAMSSANEPEYLSRIALYKKESESMWKELLGVLVEK